MKKNAFISFDFENDEILRNLLAGQARNPDTPFDFKDQSLKEHLTGDWKEKIKHRINRCDVVIVLCGYKTHTATGVAAELSIARDLNKPYFLLKGYKDIECTRPTTAYTSDKMYNWTWENLKILIGGGR